MPQATNRSLIGQMAATPTGPGTVYAAMLKARATNQERVSRVNKSEKMRLQKVQKVMDRNSRHAQWQSDQQMEQLRQSMVKLQAFQHVLREDFPANKLLLRQRPAMEHRGSHEGHSMCGKEKQKSSDIHVNSVETNLNCKGKTHEQILETTKDEVSSPDKSTLSATIDDIIRSRTTRQDIIQYENEKERKRVSFLPKHTNLSTGNEYQDKPIHASENSFDRSNKDDCNRTIANEKTTPKSDVRTFDLHHLVTSAKTNDQSETCLNEQGLLRMQYRIDRRKKMEARVVCRGFDMNTLSREINQKLRAMDPKRKRKRAQRQMVANSRQENERIIARGRAQFASNVVTEEGTSTTKDTSTRTQGELTVTGPPVKHKSGVQLQS